MSMFSTRWNFLILLFTVVLKSSVRWCRDWPMVNAQNFFFDWEEDWQQGNYLKKQLVYCEEKKNFANLRRVKKIA